MGPVMPSPGGLVIDAIPSANIIHALPCCMDLALFGAWGPIGAICHDTRGWILPTNGWTPMDEVPTKKNQDVTRSAGTNHMFAIHLQIFLVFLADMVMPLLTCRPLWL